MSGKPTRRDLLALTAGAPFAAAAVSLTVKAMPTMAPPPALAPLDVDPAGDRHMPLTSSSFDADGVRRSRLNEFALRVRSAARLDPALLYRFHASHGENPSAYSTCMHRDDAETVSFTCAVVDSDGARLAYTPSAPCRNHRELTWASFS